jgi:hypothetical protein
VSDRFHATDLPDSVSVEYVHELPGKLQEVTDPAGIYGFAYDNIGRLYQGNQKNCHSSAAVDN